MRSACPPDQRAARQPHDRRRAGSATPRSIPDPVPGRRSLGGRPQQPVVRAAAGCWGPTQIGLTTSSARCRPRRSTISRSPRSARLSKRQLQALGPAQLNGLAANGFDAIGLSEPDERPARQAPGHGRQAQRRRRSASLTASRSRSLSAAGLNQVSGTQLQLLNAAQLGRLTPTQLGTVSVATLNKFSSTQIGGSRPRRCKGSAPRSSTGSTRTTSAPSASRV